MHSIYQQKQQRLLFAFCYLAVLLSSARCQPTYAKTGTSNENATKNGGASAGTTKATTIDYHYFIIPPTHVEEMPIEMIRLGHLSIGTPEQKFLMQFSLDLPDFWVVDAKTKLPPEFDRLPYREVVRYDNSTSTTSVFVSHSIQLAGYHVECAIFNDTVTIGSVSVPNVPFGSAFWVSLRPLSNYNGLPTYDGYFGFGIEPTAGMKDYNQMAAAVRSFVYKMERKIVTIWEEPIDQNVLLPDASIKGSITIGAENTVKCSPHYSYVHYESWWIPVVRMDEVFFNDSPLRQFKSREMMLIDGFGIETSHEEAAEIAGLLGSTKKAKVRPYRDLYQVDCERMGSAPAITFRLRSSYDPGKMNDSSIREANSTSLVAGLPLEYQLKQQNNQLQQKPGLPFMDLVLDKYIYKVETNLCVLIIKGRKIPSRFEILSVRFGMQTLQNKCVSINYEECLLGFANGR